MLKAEMDKGGPNAFTNLSGHKSSYLYKDYSDNAIIEEDYFDMTPWRYKEEWKKPEWNTTRNSKYVTSRLIGRGDNQFPPYHSSQFSLCFHSESV